MAYRVLVVDPDLRAADEIQAVLTDHGYVVATVETFDQAKTQIAQDPPDLLITEVRLGAYNGFHLIVRTRQDTASIPAIVTCSADKAFIKAEADTAGVGFLPKPVHPPTCLQLVDRALAGHAQRHPDSTRRWPRKQIKEELPAFVSDHPVSVVDLSYGGLKLRIPAPVNANRPFDIQLPTLGISLTITPRWSSPGPMSYWWCGAEVTEASSPTTTRAWRDLVDSMN